MPRKFNHDYRSRCIYHITILKAAGIPAFGGLCGNYPTVGIARSPLGSIIEKNIRNISGIDSNLKILQYSIMPDHLHLLLFVTAPTDLHLGQYIGKFKILIHQDYRELTGIDSPIFEEDFYDCILHKGRSLDTLYRYIRENPRRLAVRRAFPEYFRRTNSLRIGEGIYQAYGNFQLLENPFREQVVVHCADSEDTRRKSLEEWLYTAANGGVLVSPFISPAEKAVREQAEALGSRLILIVPEILGERYKPVGHDFDLCESGRMLILSAGLNVSPGNTPSRQNCLTMNALAATICHQDTAIQQLFCKI